MLRKLRLSSELPRARRYPELAHPYRNDFQRDRDRIIHSQAFRRLEGKTQVFAPGLCDHFRNRLTHTLEVAQVARTVATTLELNEEFTETLALAHDLGHPPFAHSGEIELNRIMRSYGEDFEHNAHALRIVDRLEQRYARFDGLNLTFEVREGMVKHSREIFASDESSLREFLPGLRPPLEAQLIDPADEIAYNTADLDDAFAAGVITSSEIAASVPRFAELIEQIEIQYPGASERVQFREVQRQLINDLVGGLAQGTINAVVSAGIETSHDVREHNARVAVLTADADALNKQLKTLLALRVYQAEALVLERKKAASMVSDVFEHLLQDPLLVSSGYREHLDETPPHRVICDYIAGMTDGYLVKTHSSLVRSAARR